MNYKNATREIISRAVVQAIERVDQTDPNIARMCHSFHYLNDFRTIRINLGRNMGHTTSIGELFNPELDHLVVPKKYWTNFFKDQYRIPDNRLHNENIVRPLRVGSERMIEKESVIWIDQATTWWKDEEVSKLYASLVNEASHFHQDNFREHLPLVVALG